MTHKRFFTKFSLTKIHVKNDHYHWRHQMKRRSSNKEEKYYSKTLFAQKLKLAYEIASPRIQQYLEEEIKFVLTYINPSDTVLELGCGYGRVLKYLAEKARKVVGIDISQVNLDYAKAYLSDYKNIELHFMTARKLRFSPQSFDLVLGIQNPISSFKINPSLLVQESLTVTKNNGKILLSSYSEKIWNERLDWFIEQSKKGLIGEINFEKTKNGVIICKDGFTATTFTKEDFSHLISRFNLDAEIIEVDNSSIFCIINVVHNNKH